jgi:Large polyvalent protein-associated domain 7
VPDETETTRDAEDVRAEQIQESRRGRDRPRSRAPTINSVRAPPQARRTPAEPSAAWVAEGGAEAPPSPQSAPPRPSGPAKPEATDPWTVPDSVRDRFVQDGRRFYFPDGAPAFRDLGRRLTTVSENAQVVKSLVEIAHARGWGEISVSGTERFRQEAWRQGRLAGLSVRGYRATRVEQAQLIRALAKNLARPVVSEPDAVAAGIAPGPEEAPSAPAAAPVPSPVATGPDVKTSPEKLAGKLLEHGRDRYRHDPEGEPSYFVSLETSQGRREIWGKDLERAFEQSFTRPQLGDEVVLQKTGRKLVTVQRVERSADGTARSVPVEAHRNCWVIEKTAFFTEREAMARQVRDTAIDPISAVHEHPELTGTYLSLRAGELLAQRLRHAKDRERFLELLRTALADGIERGERLPTMRLRERTVTRPPRAERQMERTR